MASTHGKSLSSCLTLLLSTSIAFSSALPQLMRHEVETYPQLESRQDSGPYTAVTGIRSNGTYPRLEIRQLQRDADQWNLYILGLDRFMKQDESEKLSFYQIAGIHGRPYIPWDNVGPYAGNTQGPGYCTHVSNIFLPWHRPYLALYEQALYTHILAVVDTFPAGEQRSKYARAAATWRQPYWDWAMAQPDGSPTYPTSVSQATITVTLPNGTATIDNPLFAFKFHPVSVSDFYYNPVRPQLLPRYLNNSNLTLEQQFATWPTTLRQPTNWSQDAVSQNERVAASIESNRQNTQQRLYNLFTNYNNFSQFSNEAWYYGNSVSNADSLESVHDLIHAITGSAGHMTYLDYSAFDPLFWLHHAMIDRLFALYQALHPDGYVEPMASRGATFSVAAGTDIDVNTPLYPFHSNSAGDLFTSTSARYLQTFGYTYPELANNASASSIRAAINSLYGSNTGSKVLTGRTVQEDGALMERASTVMTLAGLPGETTSEGKRKQYILNLQSQKFAAKGSYAIYVFLGNFNENDASTWASTPNLVGTHGVFAALGGAQSTGDNQPDLQVTGTIPLTAKLLEKAQSRELASMNDNDVEKYLAKNLSWRAALLDGTEIPLTDVAGLDVTVVRAEVQPAKSQDSFPTWSNWKTLQGITARGESCSA